MLPLVAEVIRRSAARFVESACLSRPLWLGHANKDVTDRYAEQLKEDVEWRKQEAEKAGLGFKLPTVDSSVGLLGLPKHQKSKLKKAA